MAKNKVQISCWDDGVGGGKYTYVWEGNLHKVTDVSSFLDLVILLSHISWKANNNGNNNIVFTVYVDGYQVYQGRELFNAYKNIRELYYVK